MNRSKKVIQELETQGYGVAGVWGGPQKVKYYAPDGSVRVAIPGHLSDRSGIIYDRLILQGYSLSPPETPKPHCAGCGKWHNTEEEVKACVKRRKIEVAKWDKWASKHSNKGQDKEIKELKDELSELKDLVKQLLGKEVK